MFSESVGELRISVSGILPFARPFFGCVFHSQFALSGRSLNLLASSPPQLR
jgi:hypothetical protein